MLAVPVAYESYGQINYMLALGHLPTSFSILDALFVDVIRARQFPIIVARVACSSYRSPVLLSGVSVSISHCVTAQRYLYRYALPVRLTVQL